MALRLSSPRQFHSEGGALRATPDAARRTRADWPGLSLERYVNEDLTPREFSLAADRIFLCFCKEAPRRDGAIAIDGHEVPFVQTQGRIHLTTAGSSFRGWVDPTGSHDLLFVHLAPIFFHGIEDRQVMLEPKIDFRSAALWGSVQKLQEEMAEPGLSGTLYAETIGRMLALETLRSQHGQAVPQVQQFGGLTPRQLRIVTDWMIEYLAEPMSLKALASLVGLTPWHFCRAFRQSTGRPPYRWLADQRIARARQLLTDPRNTVTDVAFAVGFAGSSQFSRAFRRAMFISPVDYQRALN
jgi:AraC family transcriptional regulator